MSLISFVKNFQTKYPKFSEIVRFLVFGGICTIIDMFVMGVVLYVFDPSLYPNFFNVFFGGGDPSTLVTVIGTGTGFIVSLIANYIFSVVFVFKEKGNSKSVKGAITFAVFAIIGLLLNMSGMWLGYDVLHINEWITKIMMTLIVLVYNYTTRKLIIFKKRPIKEVKALKNVNDDASVDEQSLSPSSFIEANQTNNTK